MPTKLITAPTVEPITVAEVKQRLGVTHSDLDTDFGAWITEARERAEQITGRALAPQTWEKILDAFPANEIQLPWPPLTAITWVKYTDTAGTVQTLADTVYTTDSDNEPGWLLLAYDQEWPDTLDTANAVRVRYTCGYANAAAVPASIKSWLHLQVGQAYAHREAGAERPVSAHDFTRGLLDRATILTL
jgi:uncharacterized phiE125 gp8 family phage protein